MADKTSKDTFTLLFFARAADITGKISQTFEGPMSISTLYDQLEGSYPGIRAKILDSAAFTINLNYIDLDRAEQTDIKPGDEAAIIPPVSSG